MSSGDALKLTSPQLQALLTAVLQLRPSYSCKRDALTTEVVRKLGIRSIRGTPRRLFERNLNQALGVLKRRRTVEEYRSSKNVRVRMVRD